MRQIVLDTETTGISVAAGHRIIEIGAVEIVNRRITDKAFHRYINPEREIDAGATAVHGKRLEDLLDEPKFADIANEFLEFVAGGELVIHNADFDVGFLDAELVLAGCAEPQLAAHCRILDTLTMAREMHPGLRNSLDALCRRYDVDNSSRDLHGALLDASLLAQVYLAMTGGQASLGLTSAAADSPQGQANSDSADTYADIDVIRVAVTAEDQAAHERMLAKMADEGTPPLWTSAGAVD